MAEAAGRADAQRVGKEAGPVPRSHALAQAGTAEMSPRSQAECVTALLSVISNAWLEPIGETTSLDASTGRCLFRFRPRSPCEASGGSGGSTW